MQARRVLALLLVALLSGACSDDPADLASDAALLCESDDDCDDGLACSGVERCEGGACRAGLPPRCHDDDVCTRDVCLEPEGCTFVPICEAPAPEAGVEPAPPEPRMDGGDEPDDAGRDAGPIDAAIPDSGIAECTGPLHVGDVLATDPSTLESLRGVRCLVGTLSIRGNRIEQVDALSALRVITGSLLIEQASVLEDLTGLDRLELVGGSVAVTNIAGRADMDLLPALRSVGVESSVALVQIARVQRLGGFDALERAADVRVSGHPQLRWIASREGSGAFDELREVRELLIQSSPRLEAIDGFDELARVRGALVLSNVGAVGLGGAFGRLTEVGTWSTWATKMSSLRLPDRLARVGELWISGNELLEQVEIDTLRTLDVLEVRGNARLEAVNMPLVTALLSLAVFENAALEALDAPMLERIEQDFYVYANPLLEPCAVYELSMLTSSATRTSFCCGPTCEVCAPQHCAGGEGGTEDDDAGL